MYQVQDLYKDIEPTDIEAHFIGGSLDGKITEITVKKVLNKSVTIVAKDKSLYQFVEPFDLSKPLQFKHVGTQSQPEPEPVPTLLQKAKAKIVHWFLT